MATATIGVTGDYPSVPAFLAAAPGTEDWIGYVLGEAVPVADGEVWTTSTPYNDGTYRCILTAQPQHRHDGRANNVSGTGCARLVCAGDIDNRAAIEVSWLDIEFQGSLSSMIRVRNAVVMQRYHHNILHADNSTSHLDWCFEHTQYDIRVEIYRNIIYGFGGYGIYADDGDPVEVFLNTFYYNNRSGNSGRNGILEGASVVSGFCENNLFLDHAPAADIGALTVITADNNGTSDSSGDSVAGLTGLTVANELKVPYATSFTEIDCRLKDTSSTSYQAANKTYSTATYPQADVPVSEGLNETTITGTWSIGADDIVSAADTTAPTLSNATIPAAGTSITLNFDEAVTFGAGGNGGVTLSLSGGAVTATYASGDGTAALVYNLSRTILSSETGTISYTQPGDGIEDAAGNDLATFSGTSVTNNSTQTAPRSVDSVTGTFYPGATGIIVGTSNFGIITTATLGGESLTISGQVGNNVTLAVPAGIQLKLGISTYQLLLDDGTGSATLDNQTLAVTPGFELVNYDGSDPPSTDESLHKASLNDPTIGNIEADVDDQWEIQTVADVTYATDSRVSVIPPATKSNIPYRLWDNSLGQWSSFSTVTWAAEPTLTLPGLTSTGSTTMDLSVTTDVDTGTLYWYISASATPPSATDLKAGTGAVASGSISVSASGAQTDSATGLSASTTYYLHALHTNTVDSSIVTSSGVSTDSAVSVGAGSSSGVASVAAVGSSVAKAAGSANGGSTVTAVGTSSTTGTSVGAASGTSTATAVGISTIASTGSSASASTVSAVGISYFTSSAVGTSQGISSVSGISNNTSSKGGRVIFSWKVTEKNKARIMAEDKEIIEYIMGNMSAFMRGK